jgi:hypothetical protein
VVEHYVTDDRDLAGSQSPDQSLELSIRWAHGDSGLLSRSFMKLTDSFLESCHRLIEAGSPQP